MEKDSTKAIVAKYNTGTATPADIKLLENLIESGEVSLDDLRELAQLETKVLKMEMPSPSRALDDHFHEMLAIEKKKQRTSTYSFRLPDWSALLPRLAFGVVILIGGFGAGYWFNKPSGPDVQVAALSQQVNNLQEMMMLSLLEKESASERLRAVSLTTEMDQASKKVTSALIETLDNDPNVNVRLAALDALRPYSSDNNVRANLIRAIAHQDSPLVQVALAEFMGEVQEKRAVKEFNKILEGNKIPQEVKNRIKEKMQILI